MPDLTAGSTVKALDTPPAAGNTQADLFGTNSTTFGVQVAIGTYADCAVVFTAPTSGRVMIHFASNLDNDTGSASTQVAPVVRTGGTIGSGSVILAGSLNESIRNVGTDDRRYGASRLLEGLTPGSVYNVRLEHRVSGGNGTIQYRHLAVVPTS